MITIPIWLFVIMVMVSTISILLFLIFLFVDIVILIQNRLKQREYIKSLEETDNCPYEVEIIEIERNKKE